MTILPTVPRRIALAVGAALLLAAVTAPAPVAAASPGWLDPTFGSGGVAHVPPPAVRPSCGTTEGIAVAATGRIYVGATYCGRPDDAPFTDVTAFTRSGRLDTAFNRGRPLRVAIMDPTAGGFAGLAAALDGGLITAKLDASGDCTAVERFTTTGAPVTSYAPGCLPDPAFRLGVRFTRLPGGSLRICEIDDFSAPVGLFGLTPSGAVDTRVGPDGFRQLASGGCIGFTSDASGRLYWVSRRWLGDGRAAIEVRRTTHTGILDAAWGQGGSATIELSRGHLKPVTAVPAPDGSLLIGVAISDAANNAGWHGGVARLKPDGTVDAAFGTDGIRLYDPPETNGSRFLALTVDSSGRPVVSVDVPTGRPYPGPSTTGYLLRARASDGAPDPAFGRGGWVTLSRPLVGLAMAGPSRILGVTAVRDGLVLSARAN